MRIAFFHELHQGGARRAVIEFGKELKKQHEVDLYYVDAKRNKQEEKNFINTYFFQFIDRKWQGNNWKTKIYKDTIELVRLYLFHKRIAKQINDNKYDIIFVHPSKFTQSPFILRFLTGKVVYYCQEPLRIVYDTTLQVKNKGGLKQRYEYVNRQRRKNIDQKNITNTNLIIVNSQYSKEQIKKAYKKSSSVVYLGVDTTLFKPQKSKKDVDILFIGAKDPIDGYDLLEEVLQHLPKTIKVQIHNSHGKWISDQQLVKVYNRAKIVLCLAKNEPFGLIPIEAMACGVPVIAVNEGGYKESVIDGQTGYLINRDATELVQKINLLLSDTKRRESFGKQARQQVLNNWIWEASVKSLKKYFKKVV